MFRECHNADEFVVPWGTAFLLPREQHTPVDHGILLTIRRTDAVIASGGEQTSAHDGDPEVR
jgi:hypothetical protein